MGKLIILREEHSKKAASPILVTLFGITINCKLLHPAKTPLSIGDKIRYSEEDPTAKTVISITIFEDKRIVYTLEWADDDGELKQENVTLTELKVLAENMSRRLKV